MGRKKIQIRFIEQDGARNQTLGKRKIGLLKKAMELSILCDCEISVTIRPRREDRKQLMVYSSDPFAEVQENVRKYRGPYTLFNNDDIQDTIPGKNTSNEAGDIAYKRGDDMDADSKRKFNRKLNGMNQDEYENAAKAMSEFLSVPIMVQPQMRCVSVSNMAAMSSSALDQLLNPLFDALPTMDLGTIPPAVVLSDMPTASKAKKRCAEEMMDGDGDEAMGMHTEGPPMKKLKTNCPSPQRVGITMDQLCEVQSHEN